jgi:hypothetical protein
LGPPGFGGSLVAPDEQSDILVVPNTDLRTTEAGDVATFTVSLRHVPTSAVALTFESSNQAEGIVSPASVTFTPENYAAPQLVVVQGVDDDLADGPQTYVIRTSPAASDDQAFFGVDPLDVEVTNIDNDTPGFWVQPVGPLVTSEQGGEARFSVVLNSPPASDVVIPVSTDDPSEGVATPTSLVFTRINWAAPQVVLVRGVDDAVADPAQTYHVVLGAALSSDAGYNRRDPEDVELVNDDDDTPGISAYVVGDAFTTEDGSHAVVEVVLHSKPIATVAIEITSSRFDEGQVSPQILHFTPDDWAAPQTVIVEGVGDQRADGDQPYFVVIAPADTEDAGYSGFDAPDVALTNRDNETAAVRVTLPQRPATGESGATDTTFEVALSSQPTSPVQVSLTSTRQDEGVVSPTTLTFTDLNWQAPQLVTVVGQDDDMMDGNQPYSIVVSVTPNTADSQYSYLAPQWVPLINVDDDSAGILLLPLTPLVTSERGGTASFSVQLTSQPRADVILALSSSAVSEGVVDVGKLTFTPENYAMPQVVTVTGVDDVWPDGAVPYHIIVSPTVSADPAYSELPTPSVWLRNHDDDTAGVTVRQVSGAVTESGGKATLSIVLDSAPHQAVTIGLSCSDVTEGAVEPATIEFTPDNWDVPQMFTVQGQDDAIVDGDQPFRIYFSPSRSKDARSNGLLTPPVTLRNADDDTSASQP